MDVSFEFSGLIGLVPTVNSVWRIAANRAMLTPMGDGLKLIWWAIIGLVRSRVSFEAEILTLRHQLNVLRSETYLVCITPITGIRVCSRAGLHRAKVGHSRLSAPGSLNRIALLYQRQYGVRQVEKQRSAEKAKHAAQRQIKALDRSLVSSSLSMSFAVRTKRQPVITIVVISSTMKSQAGGIGKCAAMRSDLSVAQQVARHISGISRTALLRSRKPSTRLWFAPKREKFVHWRRDRCSA